MPSNKLTLSLMLFLAALLIFNQFQISYLHKMMKVNMEAKDVLAQTVSLSAAAGGGTDIAALAAKILPSGIPPVYGAELGVSFDRAAEAIPVLSRYEQDTRPDKLSGEQLARYVKIGQMTSCEFCCGARTMVFNDGRKACACAHSAAMRGAVAYLIDKHGDMTDQQILGEANKWKAVFFPGPMVQRYAAANGLLEGGGTGALEQQVGGC